jgi:hypothetical protein
MKYSTLTGSFSYDGINEFLRDLSYGKGRTNPVKGQPSRSVSLRIHYCFSSIRNIPADPLLQNLRDFTGRKGERF